jgi:decaprenylphospho-beta-D-erythro-pentofuranosid-2-ulose 2-reductase
MQDALGSVQSVLVLGAASEIAAATCRRLVAGGATRFVLAARDTASVAALADELRDGGAADVHVEAFDAAALDTHEDFVGRCVARLGDVDVVLLAFGLLGDQEQLSQDRAATVELVTVNYVGAVSVLVPLAQQLRDQGHGRIVVLSTVAAERPRRSLYTYSSSKAGLDWFAQGLGEELRGTGAGVVIVRPGFVKTKMTAHLDDAPLACTADDVADAVADALARNREIVWVPGAMRWVMSGLRHTPRPVFRRLPV